MLFCSSAALLKVVMDRGTFCSVSERFSAVTTIVSSSAEAGAVSAANARNDPSTAMTPAEARQVFDIPIFFLHIGPGVATPPALIVWRSIGPRSFHCQKAPPGKVGQSRRECHLWHRNRGGRDRLWIRVIPDPSGC